MTFLLTVFEKSTPVKHLRREYISRAHCLLTQIIAAKDWLFKLLANQLDVLLWAADKEHRLQMQEFLARNIIDGLYEEDLLLEYLSPWINHWQDHYILICLKKT